MNKRIFILCFSSVFLMLFLISNSLLAQCNVYIMPLNGDEITCDNPSLQLEAVTGGTAPFSYNWSPGVVIAGDPSIGTVYTGGTYTVTLTDAVGCTSSSSILIYENWNGPFAIINATSSSLSCIYTEVMLDASNSIGQGTLFYTWTGGYTGSSIFVYSAGVYAVTVTDSDNGCTATASYTVIDDSSPPQIVINMSNPELTCDVNSVTLDASNTTSSSGTMDFVWNTGQNTPSIVIISPGTYMVTVTDLNNGCTSTDSVVVTENLTSPIANIDSTDDVLTCANGGMVELDASTSVGQGNLLYDWSGGHTDFVYPVTSPGTYTLTITDSYNGCTATAEIFIVQNMLEPEVILVSSAPNLNFFSTVDLDATGSLGQGNLSYQWTTSETTSIITISDPGTYTVTITNDYNGCTSSGEITITKDIYVDPAAIGANNGSSWNNAFNDLQDALAIGSNTIIHVAESTYYPTTSNGFRGESFVMPQGVTLLGGYPSGGGVRDYTSHETILSGDIDGVAEYTGNSYHVVSVKDVDNVVIDGFSIRDGNAWDANSFGRSRGGGLYVKGSTLTLKNCQVKWNRGIYGAGIFATLSPDVRVENCIFKKNTGEYGSGLYHSNQTNLYVDKTRVVDNTSQVRCAIEINNSEYTQINNSVIANNNSLFANAVGFIATNRDQSCDIYNSTILGKDLDRSLITMQIGYGDHLDVNVRNTIVAHQNSNFTKNVKAFNNGVLSFKTNHCYFQGNTVIGNATNNLYSNMDGALLLNSDYSLSPCSPGVDSGLNFLGMSSTDIDGNNRIVGVVDIGAYEAQTSCKMQEKINQNQQHEKFVEVFPNPTKNILRIKTEIENPTFHLLDMMGRKLITTQEKEMDVSKFPTGIYLLDVFDGNQKMESMKIIKQ